MALTLRQALEIGVIRELAYILTTPMLRTEWLIRSGFPSERAPTEGSSYDFVFGVALLATNGKARGLEPLIEAGLQMFPSNRVLREALGGATCANAGGTPATSRIPAPPCVSDLREAVAYVVREELRITNVRRSLLPPRLCNGNPDGSLLSDVVHDWVRRGPPAASLLVAASGEGKTVATCLMQRQLADSDGTAVALWVPFRRTESLDTDPDRGIRYALRLPDSLDLWGPDASVRWLILDGLDEAITEYTWPKVAQWLDKLLRRVLTGAARPCLIVSGRDVVLLHARVQGELMGRLAVFARLRKNKRPLLLRTLPWPDAELRTALEQGLQEHMGPDEARARMNILSPGVLSSPLLYGAAFDALVPADRTGRTLDSEWALISDWIDEALCADQAKHSGDRDVAERRHAASLVALLLARSGRGMAGATLAELEQSAELNAAWFSPAHTPEAIDALRWELTVGCLLHREGDRLTFLHEQILIHLAAEAISRELGPSEGPEPPAPPDLLAAFFDKPSSLGAGPLAANNAAAQPNSAWMRAWGEVARLRFRGAPPLPDAGSPSGAHLVAGPWVGSPAVPPAGVGLALALAARDAIESALGVRLWGAPSMRMSDGSLPEGSYLVWRDLNGERCLESVHLPRGVRIAESPCTVGEYAAFLDACPDNRLPNQPAVSWRRTHGKVDYDDTHRDSPVSGISLNEARAYCRWVSEAVDDQSPSESVVRLPHPDWLRVAALGSAATQPRSSHGPFGHRGLLATVWQWIDGGPEPAVFGGSKSVGPDSPDGGVKAVVQAWPDLCRPLPANSRDPQVGFRVCRVPIELAGVTPTEPARKKPIAVPARGMAPATERLLQVVELELPDGSRFTASNVPTSLRLTDLMERVTAADMAIKAFVDGGAVVELERGGGGGTPRLNVRLTLDEAGVVEGDRLRVLRDAGHGVLSHVNELLVRLYTDGGKVLLHGLRIGHRTRGSSQPSAGADTASILDQAWREHALGDFALLAALEWPNEARARDALAGLARLHAEPRDAGPRAWATLLDDDRGRLLELWREVIGKQS